MRVFVAVLYALLLGSAALAQSDWIEELRTLQSVCSQGLLTEDECASERQRILAERENDGLSPSERFICNYYDAEEHSHFHSVSYGNTQFSSSVEAASMVRELIETTGLLPNFVVQEGPVPNASAMVRGSDRFIVYNPSWMQQAEAAAGSRWAIYQVMAHEIGHHLQGHTIQPGGSRPPIELEADEFSGWVLGRLGAPLDETLSLWSANPNAPGSMTHPPAAQRINAIQRGWQRAVDGGSATPNNPSQPAGREAPTQPVSLPQLPAPPSGQLSAPAVGQCFVSGQSVTLLADGAVVDSINGSIQGRHFQSTMPGCQFMMSALSGAEYCTGYDSYVYSPLSPVAVGGCRPCMNGMC